MVVFDTSVLLLILNPHIPPPEDPSTKKPVEKATERIEHLIKQLEESKTKILIPTPVLAQVLIRAGRAAPEYINRIDKSSTFKIVDFDRRAAIELAEMNRVALSAGDKTDGKNIPWQKVIIDRQIVAICKVEGATRLYSDDSNHRDVGKKVGIEVIGTSDLPLPPSSPEDTQKNLFEEESKDNERDQEEAEEEKTEES